MDAIAELWDTTDPADVTSYTDTDLQFARLWSSRLYDKTGEARGMADLLIEGNVAGNRSEAIDMALRVGVADVLDNESVTVTREAYDIAYMIPPSGWVTTNCPLHNGTPSVGEPDSPYVQFSAPETVRDVGDALIDDGVVKAHKELVLRGLRLLTGQ